MERHGIDAIPDIQLEHVRRDGSLAIAPLSSIELLAHTVDRVLPLIRSGSFLRSA